MLSDQELDARLTAHFEAEAAHAPDLEPTVPVAQPSRARRTVPWKAIASITAAAAAVAGLLVVPSVLQDSSGPTGSTALPGSTTGDANSADEATIFTYRLTADTAEARVAPVRVPVEPLASTAGVGDRVGRAVQALLDYEPSNDTASLWDDELSNWDKNSVCAVAGRVRTVNVTDDLISIDLTQQGLGARGVCTLYVFAYEMREQQIAWTVAAASDSRTPVRVTIDGQTNELGPGPFAPDRAVLDDLVAVRGDSGKDGFVYQEQMESVGGVRTPAEAMAWEKQLRDGAVDLTLPVYQADGITQIDIFTLKPGTTHTTDHERD